ncbi:MAG TPA: triose-phosphate isomerase [Candidatus Dormibacteraeota bacterium]|nr:triose-phosphate isomerase [Candidatus Dormibacteraeota bacterium]
MKQLRGPLLVVNFKAYIEATGKRAIELAISAEKASSETGVTVVLAPQFTDIKSVVESVNIPVFSQHLDPVKPGAFTGRVLAEAVKSAGGEGSILNHSERRIGMAELTSCVERCAESDLRSLVCADTAELGADIAGIKPDMIAIEPPDLIGSGISVSKARPELITESLQKIRAVNAKQRVLCGAGITTAEDVTKALELGMEGVLVASSVVKNKDPKSILSAMASAIATIAEG